VRELSNHELGDIVVVYSIDEDERVGVELRPRGMTPVAPRRSIGDEPWVASIPDVGDPPARVLDPLMHLALREDPASPGWAQGRSMRWSGSNARFRVAGHETAVSAGRTRITTTLTSAEGLVLEHVLEHRDGTDHLTIRTALVNGSSEAVTIDAISSFGLSGISPFDHADSAGRLVVHRLRSAWSAEARPVADTIEELHLERSWLGVARLSERFGQVGSMPSRGWFPFLAIEDTRAGVTWGAQLAWPGSWQLEVARVGDDVAMSGGLADREFGHWSHTAEPGERFETPVAIVSCTVGSVDDVAERLVAAELDDSPALPAAEESLPIVFNEWCTSWGNPDRDRLLGIADRLSGAGVDYLVIDAGWFRDDSSPHPWSSSHGDWIPSTELFPHGLAEVAARIRERGMTPGLWFEYETVGETSAAFTQVDRLLHRDGVPFTVGGRRFWDLENPAVVEYLTERVIDRLETDGFGYLKIDYNEHLGLGVDHPDGLGEGLRRQVDAVVAFVDLLHERMPDLVIENCASGGHRIEPLMVGRTAMTSFSDAHELPEIPIIAGNLLRVMPARRMQIWCVLYASDSAQRILYSLAATFIGRICLSGQILDLDDAQWSLVRRAIALYRKAAPIIRSGSSRRHGVHGSSLRHPTGWQAVTRVAADGSGLLVVVHTFADGPGTATVEVEGRWRVQELLVDEGIAVVVEPGTLRIDGLRDFDGAVVLLQPED
jgi:alpha-galactosidase